MPPVDQTRRGHTSRSTTMTCALDGRDHLISNQATQAGLAAGRGHYLAICGHLTVARGSGGPRRTDVLGLRDSTTPHHHHRQPHLLTAEDR